MQQTCRKGHRLQLVSLPRVLKFEIPLKRLFDFGRDLVLGLLHLGQGGSVSSSPRNTTALKRWSQFSHLYSMVGMKLSPNDLFLVLLHFRWGRGSRDLRVFFKDFSALFFSGIFFDGVDKTFAIPFELLLPYAGYLKHGRPTLGFENGHLL